jgi:hypothetical protein
VLLLPQAFDSLELTEEKIHAITDKIPQKPVTIVEGTSYMVIILGAFAVSSSVVGDTAAAAAAGPELTSGAPACPQPGARFAAGALGTISNLCLSCVLLQPCVQVLAFFIYNFLTNFILEPTYQTCFNATLQRLKLDPRITVRLGNDIVGETQRTAGPQRLAGPRAHAKNPETQTDAPAACFDADRCRKIALHRMPLGGHSVQPQHCTLARHLAAELCVV